ncbi:Abi family protein [Boudabousia liubingyangii]|nr:Abi family protein [Boudabousia liubingyangii]
MGNLKRATTFAEQLAILRERGMEVDEQLAEQWLKNVSYYRLSGYWYGNRILEPNYSPKNPKRLDTFKPGTTFEEIVKLYEFDRKLRTLIHDGMERIEVTLRARIGELLIHKGPLSYQDPNLFRESFDHESWLKTTRGRVERAKQRSAAIKHYDEHYDDYPFWVLADVLDFSDLSQLYDGLLLEDQRFISEGLGLKVNPEKLMSSTKKSYYRQDPLARWCEQFTVVRNTCAHHSRLWNRHFTPASTNAFRTIPSLDSLPRSQSERLYGTLLMMAFILKSVSPGSSWIKKVISLVENEFSVSPRRNTVEMGFPEI